MISWSLSFLSVAGSREDETRERVKALLCGSQRSCHTPVEINVGGATGALRMISRSSEVGETSWRRERWAEGLVDKLSEPLPAITKKS